MASGDVYAQIRPQELFVENGDVNKLGQLLPSATVFANGLGGVPLGKSDGYGCLIRIWLNGTPLPTGLTIQAMIVDDPANPGAGKVVKLGATVVPCLTTAGVLTVPAATNEVLASATVNATEGVVTIASIAILDAGLTSLAAGNWAYLRIRRVGTNAADTHPGRVILLGVTVQDT